MWINEYMNEITAFFGALTLLSFLFVSAVTMADGVYFITLKNPFLNGLVNFSILCSILSVLVLLLYPFYNSEINGLAVYFLSMIFYLMVLIAVFALLYLFFSWVGGAYD